MYIYVNADLIKRRLSDLRMTGIEFAESSGISQTTVKHLFCSKYKRVTADTFVKICDSLNLDQEELKVNRQEIIAYSIEVEQLLRSTCYNTNKFKRIAKELEVLRRMLDLDRAAG